jgi:hypothetical protein
MNIPTCPLCKKRDDMHDDSGKTICLNPPCIYARALAKSSQASRREAFDCVRTSDSAPRLTTVGEPG